MESTYKIIENIDWKIRRLVSENRQLKEELKKKENQMQELQDEIMELVIKNKELKEDKQINNLIKTINNHSENSDSKTMVNNLLKKINRSISIITKDS